MSSAWQRLEAVASLDQLTDEVTRCEPLGKFLRLQLEARVGKQLVSAVAADSWYAYRLQSRRKSVS